MILYDEINLLKAYVDAWIGIANGCPRCEGYQRWTHARQYQCLLKRRARRDQDRSRWRVSMPRR